MTAQPPTNGLSVHTPGPWLARDYKTKEGDIWVDCNAWKHKGRGGLLGGTVATALGRGAGDGTVEANAALIAAAPELLDALENLLGFGTGGGMESEQAKDDARALIIRLKGTSP